ncbi:lipid II flippase MurJ [Polynucleobacter sp. MWH-Braz-FAM2G]|uniref:lipid II flippase MurJ n=1 Tax=Polynucleobacter sp. MWH-Braz-FAM2G TaxID=1855883 RepID=UPI001BFD4904|nr:lipid II flippase MurJ [Polynucleobacter sp. MWH-Braz-FAM2G]QWD91073.1 hypothetical protein FD973_01660 [Polynucleobacter sp. MWH-Braz-FAM2G]
MVASFRKNVFWTVLLAAGAFVFSFASQIVISYFYGTSAELDAYWAALAIVNLLIFPIHPFRESLVPEIHRRSLEDSQKNASDYFSKALTLILMIAVVGLGLSFLLPNFLAGLVVSSTSEHLQSLVSQQLLWLAPAIILLALSETFNSLLASYHAVILQSVSRLLAAGSTLVIIAMMAGVVGIHALALGFMGGQLITVIALYMVIRKHGLRYRFAWPTNLGKAFFTLGGALLINYSASQIYSIYEKFIFSGFSKGLISAFQYGVSLTNVLITVLGLSLASVFWPRFLGYAASQDLDKANRDMTIALKMILLGMGVICAIIYCNAETIIDILFFRGAFDSESAIRTSQALRATIFTAIPIAASSILGRALISFGAAKNVMMIGILTAISGLLILYFSQQFNLYEMAILHWLFANVISFAVSGFLFLQLLNRPIKYYLLSCWWVLRFIAMLLIAISINQLLISAFFDGNHGIVIVFISSLLMVICGGVIAYLFGFLRGLPSFAGFAR